MDSFTSSVLTEVQQRIDEDYKAYLDTQEDVLYNEILHHARLCVRESEAFVGRQRILRNVRAYLRNENKVKLNIICL